MHLQLLEQVLDVIAGGEGGDAEVLGDHDGIVAAGDEAEDFVFAGGEGAHAGVGVGVVLRLFGRAGGGGLLASRLGDVGEDHAAGLGEDELQDADLHRHDLRVLRLGRQIEVPHAVAALGDGDDGAAVGAVAVPEAVVAGQDLAAGAAHHVVVRVAEEPLHRLVPEDDTPPLVDGEHRFGTERERLEHPQQIIFFTEQRHHSLRCPPRAELVQTHHTKWCVRLIVAAALRAEDDSRHT